MKRLIISALIIIGTLNVYSQSTIKIFSVKSNQNGRFVKIVLDEETIDNSLLVTKEYSPELLGTEIEMNNLYLIGDFQENAEGQILLDYEKFNYYYVPTNPTKPFYWINKSKAVQSGILHINNVQAMLDGGPGEVWYCCACGGCTPSAETPSGCLSSKNGNVIRCIKDGDECTEDCRGSAAVVLYEGFIIQGGGLLIQTSKKNIFHDFRISN